MFENEIQRFQSTNLHFLEGSISTKRIVQIMMVVTILIPPLPVFGTLDSALKMKTVPFQQ